MNKYLKALAVVLALTVTATMAGCSDASAKPEVTATPDTTTQPETPEPEVPEEPPVSTEWSSDLWSQDEVSVLTKKTAEVDLTVTVWDGKLIPGPTPHPWLGDGDFMITEYYDNSGFIVVPFRIEVANVSPGALPYIVINGSTNLDTEAFVALEGIDTEYNTGGDPRHWIEVAPFEPGQSVVVTGWLAVPIDYIANDGKATWVVRAGLDIDASIVWDEQTGRFMPRAAVLQG